MHSKSTLVSILVLVVGVAVWYLATTVHTVPATAPAPVTSTASPQPAPAARLQSVTPLPNSTTTVSGVDMTAFTAQANQSAAWSSQDGTADAQSTAGSGSGTPNTLDDQGTTVQ